MANNIHKLAKEALDNGNYQLAVELFECIFQISDKLSTMSATTADDPLLTIDTYIGYGDSLARCGRMHESFDVFVFICTQLGYAVPLDKLKQLTIGLLESVASTTPSSSPSSASSSSSPAMAEAASTTTPVTRRHSSHSVASHTDDAIDAIICGGSKNKCDGRQGSLALERSLLETNKCCNDIDPFACPVCYDVLVLPVTIACGHTYCRDCIYDQSHCYVCGKALQVYGNKFKQDVLIGRLIEKWWSPMLQARAHNDEAEMWLRQNALDQALKSSNASLEKCPLNYRGLALRSEVLYRLNHFQSSLADADNAIKCRPTSHKAHLNRALALTALGHIDDAIVEHCLSAHFDGNQLNYTNANRLELAKLIQKLLMPPLSSRTSDVLNVEPYYTKEYIGRCRVRALRHFPHENRTQSDAFDFDGDYIVPEWKECISEKSNLSQRLPYRKPQKMIRNLRKSRRKQQCENDANDALHRLMDLDRLASALTHTDSVDVRIRDLLDRIEFEIFKHKKLPNRSLTSDINPSSLDVTDFDCVLCYRTLWKPVVTPCGHTYCMVCLDRCLDYSTCCPLCKCSLVDDLLTSHSINQACDYSLQAAGTNCSLMSFSLSKKSVTRFIEMAMQRLIPSAFKKRQLLEIENEPSVPVFICTTAYPYVPCPLYVYEPRHRLMIRRAIESGHRQFGIVQPQSNGGYSDFGTILDIRDCVLLGNGCSILSTIGCKRFKVIERSEKDGYDTAKVEFIYDEAICEERLGIVKQLNESIYMKATSWYNSLPTHIHNEIHKSFGLMPALQRHLESITDGPAWAWYIIALLPLNQNLKVEILATTDLEKRLRAIDKTLEYVAAQQRRSVCVVSCEGLQPCQAVDCCLRATSSSQHDDDPHSHATQSHVTAFLL